MCYDLNIVRARKIALMTNTMQHDELQKLFADKDAAREHLEKIRWANGVVCPHCGVTDEYYTITPKATSKSPARKGLYKCKACGKQFTVTVGTIFEDSHIPLNKWLHVFHLVCSSKKGISAHQIHRTVGVSYKSAWFMVHRIRYAMEQRSFEKSSGTIEVDETYVGGKPRKNNKGENVKPTKRGRGTSKTPVVLVVERDGQSHAKKMTTLSAKNLREYIQEHANKEATVNTDGYTGYNGLNKHFAVHEVVDHNAGEYARGDANTNTAESWFALLKRGVYGTFHHISAKHLDRYANEFAFRWNYRKTTDYERTIAAIRAIDGKRLQYKELTQNIK